MNEAKSSYTGEWVVWVLVVAFNTMGLCSIIRAALVSEGGVRVLAYLLAGIEVGLISYAMVRVVMCTIRDSK